MVQVIGVRYTSPETYGDFNWMITQPEFSNALFIFNDNEEHHETPIQGLGNASIRPYNKYFKLASITKPRSAGIPTGTLRRGGYSMLTNQVQETIDDAIIEIKELIETYGYDSIYYSVGPSGKLGTSLFQVDQSVIDYIDGCIKGLETKN